MDLIAVLIQQLDELPAAEASIKVFTLVNGEAQTIVTALQQLFGQTTGGGQGQLPFAAATGSGDIHLRNDGARCYFCKKGLQQDLEVLAKEIHAATVTYGVNLDDLGDYRPGLKAAAERRIRHPLAEAALTKTDIRELSHRLGLRTWDRPASPCLSSRFPYGTEITERGLERVAAGERWLRARGFRECRVRYYGDRARIEVPRGEVQRLLEPRLHAQAIRRFRAIGFAAVEVDPRGFRSGSLNEALRLRPV